MSRRLRLLPVLALSLGACSQPTAPTADAVLPAADAEFLAVSLDDGVASLLDGLFVSGGPAAAPAPAILSSSSTVTFERTRDCAEGGTLTLAGTLHRVWDGEARTYDVDGSGTKTRADCGVHFRGAIYTVDGGGDWTHERHYLEGARAGVWRTTYAGDFDWAKSTGESGSCEFDLTRVYDVATKTLTLDGFFCSTEIHNSRTFGTSD